MAFSFRRHIILSRLHDLRTELSIADVEQKKAEEEEKKKPKKAKKPESEKARKTKRRIIIFLYVAGIALCIATLTYVMIYFYIENGVFGDDDWRENRLLFALYDWLMEDEPVSDGLYSLKKEYYYGFSLLCGIVNVRRYNRNFCVNLYAKGVHTRKDKRQRNSVV